MAKLLGTTCVFVCVFFSNFIVIISEATGNAAQQLFFIYSKDVLNILLAPLSRALFPS